MPSTISSGSVRPASLARRLLFPHVPPTSELPPLFAHGDRDLDDETYDLIALALRAFVNTWWTKLTRYDREFLPQIAAIVTHVLRALEQRVIHADLSLLVFGDVPALVAQHYSDYRQAVSKASTSYAAGGALSLPQLFHQLQPHMAISSDGTLDDEYFRQAFDHVLRECLPSEDYAPETERFIVREIMLKVVVKDIIPRITQPWFIQKMVLDMLGPSPDVSPEQSSRAHSRVSKSSVIVFLLSAIQRLSGACIMLIHAYKQVVYIIPVVNQSNCRPMHGAGASPVPENADLTHGLLCMVSEVLRVQDRLAATALMHTTALFCRSFQTFMNKLLCYLLYTHVLSASSLLSVVRVSKRTLFPNGYPGPPPVDPTVEEQAAIREALAKRLGECVPGVGRGVLLGDPAVDTVDGVVDGLSDEACNRHLVVFLVDAILLSLFSQ